MSDYPFVGPGEPTAQDWERALASRQRESFAQYRRDQRRRDNFRRFEMWHERAAQPHLEGIQFSDGAVAVRWGGNNPSLVVWPSLKAFEAVSHRPHLRPLGRVRYRYRPST